MADLELTHSCNHTIEDLRLESRKHLLAKMASHIAAGVELYEDWDYEDVAQRAVGIAEQILKRVGL